MDNLRQLPSLKLAADPLGQLFNDYYDRLVFFAWQMVKDRQQAEDIAQDAFISYWQQREHVADHPIAIKNFLYSSVRNAGLNVIRHARVVEQFNSNNSTGEFMEPYIIEAIISAEIIAEVSMAIDALPQHLQLLTKLSFIERKKNQEVADELQMSVNTVKKQKQQALKLLKGILNPDTYFLLITSVYFMRS